MVCFAMNTFLVNVENQNYPVEHATHLSLVDMTLLSTEQLSSVKKCITSRERGMAPGLASCSTIICSRGDPTS